MSATWGPSVSGRENRSMRSRSRSTPRQCPVRYAFEVAFGRMTCRVTTFFLLALSATASIHVDGHDADPRLHRHHRSDLPAVVAAGRKARRRLGANGGAQPFPG